MKKTLSVIAGALGIILLFIIGAGMYKFNYLASLPGYDVDGNKIEHANKTFPLGDFTVVESLDQKCTQNIDCKTPERYLVRSSCPFTTTCLSETCTVVCPEGFIVPEKNNRTHSQTTQNHYICEDGYTFSVYHDEYGVENKKIALAENEIILQEIINDSVRSYSLVRSNAASGEKYDDKNGFTFWAKGDEGFIMQDEEIIHRDCVLQNQTPTETIYFDPIEKNWKDQFGICHSCTPEHGFQPDGLLSHAPDGIWTEVFFGLKNDLDQSPTPSEVQKFFADFYNADPQTFGTHVEFQNDVFRIILATDAVMAPDFMDPRGFLLATYSVTESSREAFLLK